MFKGTQRNPAPVFSRAVTAAGGQENAFTSYDYTGYFQRVVANQLPAMMDFEADRMTGLVLTDAVVLPERDVVLEERRQRIDNDPGARLGERMQARLWGEDHPTASRSSASSRRSGSSTSTTPWPSTGAITRRTTPSSSSPAT